MDTLRERTGSRGGSFTGITAERLMRKEDVDERVEKLTSRILSKYHDQLAAVGISEKLNSVKVWCSEEDAYESELSIEFWRQNRLIDVLEFHIFRDGKQIASFAEIVRWLTANLKQIMSESIEERETGPG